MKYTLNRYEKNKDKEGKIIAIFIAVNILDDNNNNWTQEYYLNSQEITDILVDETKLTAILETQCAKGEKALENYLIIKPQAPVIADENKRSNFIINAAKVAIEKAKL